MGSRSRQPKCTLSGVRIEALRGSEKAGHLSIGIHDDQRVVVLLFAGADMEIIFYDSEPVVFRRKTHVYHNAEIKSYSGEPIGRCLTATGDAGKGLPGEEFRVRLLDNLIICLKRTMAPHDIVADSSQLGGVISKALDDMFKVANTTTDDADAVREQLLDARMRLFTRYVGLDKRRTQPNE